MTEEKEIVLTINDLPVTFQVKYLGFHPARGLWGIKNTRKPVDSMVEHAKHLPTGKVLPFVKVVVSKDGLSFKEIGDKASKEEKMFRVDTISYGVQDLVYTRVFSMIVVMEADLKEGSPFMCHAFVCESRNQARQLTYALAAAFKDYGRRVQDENKDNPDKIVKKRFAIDLRTPEEMANESEEETEA